MDNLYGLLGTFINDETVNQMFERSLKSAVLK